jgi:hypothetical protein
MLLEEHELWHLMEKKVLIPTDVALMAEYNKKVCKVKHVILNSMNDHLIPHIIRQKTKKEMCDAIVIMYQSENINQKLLLRDELKAT